MIKKIRQFILFRIITIYNILTNFTNKLLNNLMTLFTKLAYYLIKMKNTKLIILLALFSKVCAQQTLSVNQVTGDQSVFSGIKSTTGKTLKYEEIQGSPYFDLKFHEANVAENYEKIPIRYNSYKDEVEFQKGNLIQVLPKDSKFSKIEIISPKQTIVLLNTGDENSGYLFELISGKNSLLKKIKTKFTDIVPAASSYATERPANFRMLEPVYYIKTEKGYHKVKNQKNIFEQFPELKEKLETFFKSNKIKFNQEEDLVKLVTFLNQN